MKIVNQSGEVWGECPTDRYSSVLWIERAGRVCWRTEDKIVDGSGETFVNNILKKNHGAVIEASNLVIRSKDRFKIPVVELEEMKNQYDSKYISFCISQDHVYAGGNWRAWMEVLKVNSIDDLLGFFKEHPTYEIVKKEDIPLPLKRISVELNTDRAVTHEIVRHRPCSFLQESQRYCSYMKQLKFIRQWWWKDLTPEQYENTVKKDLVYSEKAYKEMMNLLKDSSQIKRSEKARYILPNATATRIVITADIEEWNLIFSLRCTGPAYPQMRNIMKPIQACFKESGWILS